MPTTLPPDIEAQAINIIRGFAMDAPLQAKSGHQGTAMALAPLANVLYSRILKHDPDDPDWPDRDRFILSNGHASILQYSMLYLTGYGLQLADIKAFRSFDSRTPGHPEARHTRASRSPPARSARASATPSGWPSPSASCASASAASSSTTTPTSSPATAASWRASATRPPRSPATSASAG